MPPVHFVGGSPAEDLIPLPNTPYSKLTLQDFEIRCARMPADESPDNSAPSFEDDMPRAGLALIPRHRVDAPQIESRARLDELAHAVFRVGEALNRWSPVLLHELVGQFRGLLGHGHCERTTRLIPGSGAGRVYRHARGPNSHSLGQGDRVFILTVSRSITLALISCLPACSKFTVTRSPITDWT